MTKLYFGTDGIRGRVGDHPITAEFMLKLGWASGKVFAQQERGLFLIGKDTRVSGYMFESALEAGLVSAGVDVALLGPMPTPAIAYLTRTFNASAGIVISASHNRYQDNGVKFFSRQGTKLDDEIELLIEKELAGNMAMVSSDRIGKVSRINDAAGRYIEFCKSCFPGDLDLRGMRIALDCANGATYHVAPSVFRELGAEVVEMGVEPDGFNINENVGSTSTAALQELVRKEKANLGIALDGDGDRVIMIDDKGNIVDGDEILFIIASSRKAAGELEGGVVGTQMSNFGLEEAFGQNGIPFRRAKVGDRYVMAELARNRWSFGGESSGHVLCLDCTTTGDGIVSSLQVLAAVVASGQTLAELAGGMKKYPQHMINVACSRKFSMGSDDVIAKAVHETEQKLAGKGRVLLRPSGTEPVIRVMVEGEEAGTVAALTEHLADVVAQEMG